MNWFSNSLKAGGTFSLLAVLAIPAWAQSNNQTSPQSPPSVPGALVDTQQDLRPEFDRLKQRIDDLEKTQRSTSVSDALKELADKEKDLRKQVERLTQRFDTLEQVSQSAISVGASQSQSVLGTATNHIYACTAMIMVVTAILAVTVARQFFEFRRLHDETERMVAEAKKTVGAFSNEATKEMAGIRQETEATKSKLDELTSTTTKQLETVKNLEDKLVDEVKGIERTNESQANKLQELEQAGDLVRRMEHVVRSHQPPNRIKREIVALLLFHKWPEDYYTRLAQALAGWSGDGGEVIAPSDAKISVPTDQPSVEGTKPTE